MDLPNPGEIPSSGFDKIYDQISTSENILRVLQQAISVSSRPSISISKFILTNNFVVFEAVNKFATHAHEFLNYYKTTISNKVKSIVEQFDSIEDKISDWTKVFLNILRNFVHSRYFCIQK